MSVSRSSILKFAELEQLRQNKILVRYGEQAISHAWPNVIKSPLGPFLSPSTLLPICVRQPPEKQQLPLRAPWWSLCSPLPVRPSRLYHQHGTSMRLRASLRSPPDLCWSTSDLQANAGSGLPKVSLEVQPCYFASGSLLDFFTFLIMGRDSALSTFRRRPQRPHRRWALTLTRIMRWWYLDLPARRNRHSLMLARGWTNSVDQGSIRLSFSFSLSLRLRLPSSYLWLSICTAATRRLESSPRGATRSQLVSLATSLFAKAITFQSMAGRQAGFLAMVGLDRPINDSLTSFTPRSGHIRTVPSCSECISWPQFHITQYWTLLVIVSTRSI
jgi:hypothetical protein